MFHFIGIGTRDAPGPASEQEGGPTLTQQGAPFFHGEGWAAPNASLDSRPEP